MAQGVQLDSEQEDEADEVIDGLLIIVQYTVNILSQILRCVV